MSQPGSAAPFASWPAIRAPMLWGIVVGLLQAATPLLVWWLNSATSPGLRQRRRSGR